ATRVDERDAAALGLRHGDAAASPEPAPEPEPQVATCLLIDRQTGRTFTGSAPTAVIGRERSQAQIVLRDPNVSRRHAELRFDGRDWRIADLNSTNGTLVNDVDVKECVLRDGDLITVGLVNLEFRENR
uniref:FHA domain-containing protein n=1 Tax=Paratractidigestivibacter faecalis TaxID=2292441 RepID=UPI003A933EF0